MLLVFLVFLGCVFGQTQTAFDKLRQEGQSGLAQPCGPRAFLGMGFVPGVCTLIPCSWGEYETSGDCKNGERCCISTKEESERAAKRLVSVTYQSTTDPCDFGSGIRNGACAPGDDTHLPFELKRARYPTVDVRCQINFKTASTGSCHMCCFGGLTESEANEMFERGFEEDASQFRFDLERHMKGTYSEFVDWFKRYIAGLTASEMFQTDQFRGVSEYFILGVTQFLGLKRTDILDDNVVRASTFKTKLMGDPQEYREAAERLAQKIMMRWNSEGVRQAFVDDMMGKIREGSRRQFFVVLANQMTKTFNTEDKLKSGLKSFDKVTVTGMQSTLRNFFYGHRSYAAMAPLILRDPTEFSKYIRFVDQMTRSNDKYPDDSDTARVIRYYKQLPRKIPVGNSDISAAVSAMEGNPYMAAWALAYISKHNSRSNAVKGATTWLQQPIEVDIYIPPHLARRIKQGETINWPTVISRDIKVGHGKTMTMISELLHAKFSEGCEVTSNSDVSKFIELGTWLKVVNAALRYILSDVTDFDPQNDANTVLKSSRAKTGYFSSLLGIDLQLILDIKCQFEKGTPIDEFVKALNDEYGVVVAGLGSFYQLPKLTHIQQGMKMTITAPPVNFQWFFSPKNLEQGLKEGRVSTGATALVTASSLIKLVSKKYEECVYQRDTAALELLRRLRNTYRLDLGMWTQEAQLTQPAFRFLSQLANDERELFNRGFALGGLHDWKEWPLLSKCTDMGGLSNFDYIPNK